MIHQNTSDIIEPDLKKIQRLCMLYTQILMSNDMTTSTHEPQAMVSYIEPV